MTSAGAPAPAAPTSGLRAARFALYALGLMWLLPFLQPVHRYPLTSFRSEWIALVVGMAALLPLIRREAWRGVRVPLAALVPLIFILVLALQGALSMLPYLAQFLTPALYLIWAAFLIVLAYDLKRTLGMQEIAVTLAVFVVVGGLLGALAGYVQHFDSSGAAGVLVSRKNGQAVYGNLAQRNHFGGYLTLAIVSLVYLFARERVGWRVMLGCVLTMLPALALSGSRSIWLYLVVLLAASASVRLCGGEAVRSRIVGAMIAVTGLFIAAQWLVTLPLFDAASFTTAGQRLFEESASGAIRLQLWREALAVFAQSPWLGAGFGNFAWQHFLQQAQSPVTAVDGLFNNAHNIVLHLLAETGLAGFAVIAAAMAAWAVGVLRATPSVERWWLVALCGVLGVHSLLEYPLWYAYFLGICAVLVGLGAARAFPLKSASAGHWIVAGALVAGGFNAAGVLNGYLDLERAVGTRVLESAAEREDYRRAFVDASRDPVLEPYADFGLSAAIEVSPENLAEKIRFNERVMRLAPTARVVYLQAALRALNGDVIQAQRLFRLAMAVFPGHLPVAVDELTAVARRYPGPVDALLELAVSEKGSR